MRPANLFEASPGKLPPRPKKPPPSKFLDRSCRAGAAGGTAAAGGGSVFFGLAVGGMLLPPPPPPPPPGSPTPEPSMASDDVHVDDLDKQGGSRTTRGAWSMFETPRFTSAKADFNPTDSNDGAANYLLPLCVGEAMVVLGETADKCWYLGASAGCRQYKGVFPASSVHVLIENRHFSTFGMSAHDMGGVGGANGVSDAYDAGAGVGVTGTRRDTLGFERSPSNGRSGRPHSKNSGGGNGGGGVGSNGSGGGGAGSIDGGGADPHAVVLAKQRKEWSKLRATAEGAALLNDPRHQWLWQRWRMHVTKNADGPPPEPSEPPSVSAASSSSSTAGANLSVVTAGGRGGFGGGLGNAFGSAGLSPEPASSKASSAAKQVTAIIHVGIPPELRDQVWFLSSGAVAKHRNCCKAERYSVVLIEAERRAARSQEAVARRIDRDQQKQELQGKLQQQQNEGEHGLVKSTRALHVSGNGTARDQEAEDLEEDEEDAQWQAAIDIEKDLRRTFPTNSNFQSEQGIDELRRVLLAYALRNPGLGYCQSMNFITAMLLLHMPEERAFWTLAAIVEDLLPPEYFQGRMVGMRTEQRVLQSCLLWKLPRTSQHLKNNEVDLDQVTVPWFMCLFVNSLPLDVLLRVWDCFFHEGVKALHRVALAIFKLKSKEILAMDDMADIFMALRSPCSSGNAAGMGGGGVDDQTSDGRGSGAFTADRVIKTAWATTGWLGSFSTDKIAAYRQKHVQDLVQNQPMEHLSKSALTASYSPSSSRAVLKFIPVKLPSSLIPSLPGRRRDSLATAIMSGSGGAPEASSPGDVKVTDGCLDDGSEWTVIHDEAGYSHY